MIITSSIKANVDADIYILYIPRTKDQSVHAIAYVSDRNGWGHIPATYPQW